MRRKVYDENGSERGNLRPVVGGELDYGKEIFSWGKII